jgi:hypothetical protein
VNDSIIASINAVEWDKIVAILSVLGGIFGGIPTIWKWISKPRLYIKDFGIQGTQRTYNLDFTVANRKIISKDITEIDIRCLVKTKGGQLNGIFSLPGNVTPSMALQYTASRQNTANIQNVMRLQVLSKGTSTIPIRFVIIEELPDEFDFYVYMTFKEGSAKLKKKHKRIVG